jgi:UPF0755 protein
MPCRLSKPVIYIIRVLEVILLVILVVVGYNFFLPVGEGKSPLYFPRLQQASILNILQTHGFNIYSFDRYLIDRPLLTKPGWYDITETEDGRYHFFHSLGMHPAKTMKVKIYAGETSRELIDRLANDMKLDPIQLEEAYKKHSHFQEADILSGTYTVARNADVAYIISYLFDRSDARFEAFKHTHYLSDMDDETLKLLLTVASIVQKETNDPKEMPLIASVIYNRLGKGMKLQMDSTLNYGEYSHQIVTPERIKQDMTYYNTYKYKGLPPAPLATVSLDALTAAMFPATTQYLFFMLDPKGGHTFAVTYKEHRKNLKSFREYQKQKHEKKT